MLQLLSRIASSGLMVMEELEHIVLAHELFYGIEEQQGDDIFTRKEKITLWGKPFSRKAAGLSQLPLRLSLF
jgi:hypothetical protein